MTELTNGRIDKVTELTNGGIDRVIEMMSEWKESVIEMTNVWVDEATGPTEDGTKEAIVATSALIKESIIGTDIVRIATRIEGGIVAIICIPGITIGTADICIHCLIIDIIDEVNICKPFATRLSKGTKQNERRLT